MKRLFPACVLLGAILLASGCGQSKPEVPSWFKGDKKDGKDGVVAKNSPQQLKADLSDKIRKLEKKMNALDEAITSVKGSKSEIKNRLLQRGVGSSEDLKKPEIKGDEEVERLVANLTKKIQEQAKYEQMRKQYNIAFIDGKDALESLERQLKLAQAGISEKEMDDLAVTIKKIDERLNATDPGNPVDLIKGDHGLEKELKGN